MGNKRLSLIWRILIVFLATAIIWWISGGINGWVRDGEGYSRTAHIASAIVVFSLVLPVIISARRYLDKRPWSGLDLTTFKKGWKPFVFGGLSYFIPASLGLVIFVVLGWTNVSIHVSAGELILSVLMVTILVFMFEALPEELIFRGYFYRNLNGRFSKWTAILIQSGLFILFAVIVGAAQTADRIILFLAVAIVIGVIRVITENVWGAVGFHLAFQTMQQMFSSAYNTELTTETHGLMEIVILGIIPFSFAIITLKLFIKKEPEWTEIDPE